jgi:CO/xanthine dehydrogenase Mo-binding subunit
MNYMPKMNRRAFVVNAAAAGGGLALGFHLPFGPDAAHAAAVPEVNAWVVVQPDETVIIRIARSEMGQGTLTGLAQLAAEELECDWSKVTYEFPTPGQNVARKRVWGDFFTAGSRGLRTSNDFVRKGGAAARMMLIEAAANEWKVPVQECTAANGVITHKASKGRGAAREVFAQRPILGSSARSCRSRAYFSLATGTPLARRYRVSIRYGGAVANRRGGHRSPRSGRAVQHRRSGRAQTRRVGRLLGQRLTSSPQAAVHLVGLFKVLSGLSSINGDD